jgi:hypothetical protein
MDCGRYIPAMSVSQTQHKLQNVLDPTAEPILPSRLWNTAVDAYLTS